MREVRTKNVLIGNELFRFIPLDRFSQEDRILRFSVMDIMGDIILKALGVFRRTLRLKFARVVTFAKTM